MATQTQMGRRMGDQERRVVQFINETLTSILDELRKPDGRPSVTLRRRSSHSPVLNPQTGTLEPSDTTNMPRVYSWPGRTPEEAWRFGVIIRILGSISEALRGDFVCSKRDIFYQDPIYFGSQKIVDRCIDNIACTIGVDRTALHVVAAAKGLTAGSYTVLLKDGKAVRVGSHAEGTLIPRVDEVLKLHLDHVKWIIVVEKEAVFHRLVTANYQMTSGAGEGIMITGKGYPDLSTRAFVQLLSETKIAASQPSTSPFPCAMLPIYLLVDWDPDGLAILSTYKYGSIAQLHENAKLSVSRSEWLGLRMSKAIFSAGERCALPLSFRDRKKAMAMLSKSPVFADGGPESEWRVELQRMLMLNSKAEIEILYERPGGIEVWLDEQLQGMR
ncbi:hypothetical protein VTO42DRAFT_6426 [Malbranchea cinnamomea]